jgi:hypothetical protein
MTTAFLDPVADLRTGNARPASPTACGRSLRSRAPCGLSRLLGVCHRWMLRQSQLRLQSRDRQNLALVGFFNLAVALEPCRILRYPPVKLAQFPRQPAGSRHQPTQTGERLPGVRGEPVGRHWGHISPPYPRLLGRKFRRWLGALGNGRRNRDQERFRRLTAALAHDQTYPEWHAQTFECATCIPHVSQKRRRYEASACAKLASKPRLMPVATAGDENSLLVRELWAGALFR